ncbi:MAG: hypothetical protein HRU19_32125 [Pseudobacteriovorax sp.]|nr:hypothetical protein [Pseudobacteriovorax sp.]
MKQSVFSESNQHGFDVSLQCKIPLSGIDSFKKELQTTLDDRMASWARGASYSTEPVLDMVFLGLCAAPLKIAEFPIPKTD